MDHSEDRQHDPPSEDNAPSPDDPPAGSSESSGADTASDATVSPPQPGYDRRAAWACCLLLPIVLGPLWVAGANSYPADHWSRSTTPQLGSFLGFVLLAMLLICSYTDLSWQKIYNWATMPAFLWGIVINLAAIFYRTETGELSEFAVQQLGAIGILRALLGTFGSLLVFLLIHRGGAGDLKLVAAMGTFLGVQQTLSAVIWSFAVGGIFILSVAIWSAGPVTVFCGLYHRVGNMVLPGLIPPMTEAEKKILWSRISMAASLAAGTVILFCHGNILAGELPWQ